MSDAHRAAVKAGMVKAGIAVMARVVITVRTTAATTVIAATIATRAVVAPTSVAVRRGPVVALRVRATTRLLTLRECRARTADVTPTLPAVVLVLRVAHVRLRARSVLVAHGRAPA